MPQSIANGVGAKAGVEKIIISHSSGHQVKRAKEMEEFAERPRALFEPGEPLDVATRRRMEAFFGYSLEEVRIHRGHDAETRERVELSLKQF